MDLYKFLLSAFSIFKLNTLFPRLTFEPLITTIHQTFQMADLEKYPVTLPTICLSIKDGIPVGQGRISVSLPPRLLVPIDLPVERTEVHNFPEGGLKAYLTVVGSFMALACTFGQLSAFGTFQAWYASHQLQHLPASTISWIGSLQFWVFFFSVCFNFDLSLHKSFPGLISFSLNRVLPSDACLMPMDQLR